MVEINGRPVLKARVAAPPVDGAANQALCRLIGKAAGVPPSCVSVAAGSATRYKQLMILSDGREIAGKLASFR